MKWDSTTMILYYLKSFLINNFTFNTNDHTNICFKSFESCNFQKPMC